jgi:hypothetical protein
MSRGWYLGLAHLWCTGGGVWGATTECICPGPAKPGADVYAGSECVVGGTGLIGSICSGANGVMRGGLIASMSGYVGSMCSGAYDVMGLIGSMCGSGMYTGGGGGLIASMCGYTGSICRDAMGGCGVGSVV